MRKLLMNSLLLGLVAPAAIAAPTINLSASPLRVAPGGTSLVTWSVAGASWCVGSNETQSAPVGFYGQQRTPALSKSMTITVRCTGPSGTASRAVTIEVGATTSGSSGTPTSGGSTPSGSTTPSSGGTTTTPSTGTTTGGSTSGGATAGAGSTTGTTTQSPTPIPSSARYASPNGTGNCEDVSPCSLSLALQSGGTVILKDGTYPAIGWTGSTENVRIPSGSASAPTVLRAQNDGRAIINGIWIGRSTRKDSNIRIEGVRVEGGVTLYNTQRITLKRVGVHGPLSIGTNDHTQGNTDNLIEDVWVWASGQRVVAINYRADRNVWRRVIVRGDGCGTGECSGSGNPNVGITIYDSSGVSFQNVLVMDRILASTDSPYADFACAQHTSGQFLWGANEWLGILSINAPDQSLYCEPDFVLPGVVSGTIRDAVLWNGGGLNLARQGQFALERVWSRTRQGDAFRLAPELAGTGSTLRSLVAAGSGRYGINTAVGVNGANVTGSWSQGAYNQAGCVSNCSSAAPTFSPLSYFVRYGVDGTRYGEAGYNVSQSTSALPWPNEARIKSEMCASTSRGFCASGVSDYISSQLK